MDWRSPRRYRAIRRCMVPMHGHKTVEAPHEFTPDLPRELPISRFLGLFDALLYEVYVGGGITHLCSSPAKDTHIGDRFDAELAGDRRVPIHDVDFEQSDIRVGLGQLF